MTTIPTSDVELWTLCGKKEPERLVMWVLYENPADFPGKWVARFYVCDMHEDRRAVGTKFHEVGNTRSAVEECLPYIEKGRWRFYPEFDPHNPQIIGVYR